MVVDGVEKLCKTMTIQSSDVQYSVQNFSNFRCSDFLLPCKEMIFTGKRVWGQKIH